MTLYIGSQTGLSHSIKDLNQDLTLSQFAIISPATIAMPPKIRPMGLLIIAMLNTLIPIATALKTLLSPPKTKDKALRRLCK